MRLTTKEQEAVQTALAKTGIRLSHIARTNNIPYMTLWAYIHGRISGKLNPNMIWHMQDTLRRTLKVKIKGDQNESNS